MESLLRMVVKLLRIIHPCDFNSAGLKPLLSKCKPCGPGVNTSVGGTLRVDTNK